MRNLLASAAVALAFAIPAHGQQASPGAQQFAEKAAMGDMFEIQTSELAIDRSRNTDVEAFARKIIQDHRANSEELKSLLQRSTALREVKLPTALDAPHQQKLQQLKSSASAFDPQYRTIQVAAHEGAIKLFEDYARAGDNAELKEWAAKKVPVLRHHLELAQALPRTAAPSTNVSQQQPTAPQTGAQRQLSMLATPGPDHIMASDLEGTSVRSATDENVGEIDDVVVDRSGRIVAVIVGVGGFLGIGEKNVAIPFEALEIVGDENARNAPATATGSPAAGTTAGTSAQSGTADTIDPSRIVLRGMTREDLERAPEFKAGAR